MELSGALGRFAGWVVGWAVNLGALAVTVWACWTFLQVLVKGGKGRAVWELIIGLAVVAVVFAALKDLPGTLALVGGLGEQAWGAISAELRAGLR
jgi:hypothetical protein